MKKADVKIGAHYIAKVSGKLTIVRVIMAETRGGYKRASTGYRAINIRTGREIFLRTAGKLRRFAHAHELERFGVQA